MLKRVSQGLGPEVSIPELLAMLAILLVLLRFA